MHQYFSCPKRLQRPSFALIRETLEPIASSMRRSVAFLAALAAASVVEGYAFAPITGPALSARAHATAAAARPLRAASLARPRTVLRMSADFAAGMCEHSGAPSLRACWRPRL